MVPCAAARNLAGPRSVLRSPGRALPPTRLIPSASPDMRIATPRLRLVPLTLLLAGSAALTGCVNSAGALTAVDAAVERYHQQYNAAQFAEIYRASDAEMQRAQPEA